MVTVKSKGAGITIKHVDPPMYAREDMAMPCPPPDTLGDDFNIPLLVLEAGSRQLARMQHRRSRLEEEMKKLDVDIRKLEKLVAAASTL